MKSSVRWLLLGAVVLLLALPLALNKGADFSGADSRAEAAITEIDKGYQPWAKPLFEPASGEVESLLFALQAALGAGVIAYYLGYQQGRKQTTKADV